MINLCLTRYEALALDLLLIDFIKDCENKSARYKAARLIASSVASTVRGKLASGLSKEARGEHCNE